tara:strand:- start:41 stop:877 length:837 start_codon:yes stop_codon:yes gene_type:complete
MGTPGKNAKNNLSKQLGLQIKGSPYSMNQPLHGNAFIGAKVKAEKQGKNSFDVGGETFPVKKNEAPTKFIGALIAKGVGGAIAKTVAKKAVTKVGGSLIKKGLATMASLPTGSMDGLSAPTLAPKGKTGMGKALSTIGSSIKEGVRGLGEGISEKAGGSPKGFGDKVKNYIGSLDLITDSNPDGSIRKEGQEPIPATQVPQAPSGPGDVSTTGQPVGEDLKIKSLDKGPSTSADSVYNQGGEISIDKTANKNRLLDSLTKVPTEMGGPLNKIKNMCRG